MSREIFYKNSARLGVSLTDKQVETLYMFVDLLIEWNSKINLVGTGERSRIINELMLDSMVPVPYLPENGNLVDLGSGAGFPALIIKILKPGLEVKLIESNGKKVSFLKYAIHSLKIKGIAVLNKRIEKITDELRAWGCDMVTSRAMASLDKIIMMSKPFLKNGGLIVGFLGKNADKELKNTGEMLNDYNFNLENSIKYHLPEKESERTTVLLKKISSTEQSHY